MEKHLHACHHCDLLVEVPFVEQHSQAICPRCKSVLVMGRPESNQLSHSLLWGALIFLILSVFPPFLSMETGIKDHEISLMNGILGILEFDEVVFGFFTLILVVFYPAIILFLLLGLLNPYIKRYREHRFYKKTLRVAVTASRWIVAEVFILGVLVSLTKIAELAEIGFGPGFYLYITFLILLNYGLYKLNLNEILGNGGSLKQNHFSKKTLTESRTSCEFCGHVVDEGLNECGCCGGTCHRRKPDSIHRTVALLITSIILFIPANTFPIMKTLSFGQESKSTILEGAFHLWEGGSFLIAVLIIIASFVVPLGKILILSYLCYSVIRKKRCSLVAKTRSYEITELLGKWSMIDVFVVMNLVTLVQMGQIMAIQSSFGVLAFAGVVISTMIAAHCFDPRLIWDVETIEK